MSPIQTNLQIADVFDGDISDNNTIISISMSSLEFFNDVICRFRLKLDPRQRQVLSTFANTIASDSYLHLFDYLPHCRTKAVALFNSVHAPNYFQVLKPRRQNELRALMVALVVHELQRRGVEAEEMVNNHLLGFDVPYCNLNHAFRFLECYGLPPGGNEGLYVMTCGFLEGTKRSYTMGGMQNDEVAFLRDIYRNVFQISTKKRTRTASTSGDVVSDVSITGITDDESLDE